MWDNIGEKIKGFAKFSAWIGIIISIIGGIALIGFSAEMRRGGELYFSLGIVTIIFGPLISWISAWFMYGYGELIEKTNAIEKNTRSGISANVMTGNISSPNDWICNKCKSANRETALFCNNCGEKKLEDVNVL